MHSVELKTRLRLIEKSATPVLDLAVVKAHNRIETSDDDALLQLYMNAAVGTISYLDRALVPSTYALDLNFLPHDKIELPKPSLNAVTAITVVDWQGIQSTVDTSIYEVFKTQEGLGLVELAYNKRWPQTRGDLGSASIQFTAGAELPSAIATALLMLIGHWYDNRAPITPSMQHQIPMTISDLLHPFRTHWFV